MPVVETLDLSNNRLTKVAAAIGGCTRLRALDLEDAKGNKDEIAASYRKAIDEWAKLVSKYPESAEARDRPDGDRHAPAPGARFRCRSQ